VSSYVYIIITYDNTPIKVFGYCEIHIEEIYFSVLYHDSMNEYFLNHIVNTVKTILNEQCHFSVFF